MACTWIVKDGKNVYNKGVGMKVYVYNEDGDLAFNIYKDNLKHKQCDYVGEFDLDIKQSKKTVRKEMDLPNTIGQTAYLNIYNGSGGSTISMPTNAKNIKITYEVEE
jgi:hypothetical protein